MNGHGGASQDAQPKSRVADSSTGYIPRLESLRGLGALMVAAFHSAQATWAPNHSLLSSLGEGHWSIGVLAFLYHNFCNGHGALITFFVISGLVLTRTLKRGPEKFWPASKRFFVTRIFRIYPAIISTVFLFALLYWGFGCAIPGVPAEAYTLRRLIRNMLLLETSIDGVM